MPDLAPFPCRREGCSGIARAQRARLYALTGCGLGLDPDDCVATLDVSATDEARDADGYVPLSIREAGGAQLRAWLDGASYEDARAARDPQPEQMPLDAEPRP
jgi:hypothetical protein